MGLISNYYSAKYSSNDPFGSDRTRKWNKDAENYNSRDDMVDESSKGYQTPESQKARMTQRKRALKQVAPPSQERTKMNGKQVGDLGSGRWEAVA